MKTIFETQAAKQEEIQNLKAQLRKVNKVLIDLKITDPKLFDGSLIQENEQLLK